MQSYECGRSAYEFFGGGYKLRDGSIIDTDRPTFSQFDWVFNHVSYLQHNQICQFRHAHGIVHDQIAIGIEEVFVTLSEMVGGVEDEKKVASGRVDPINSDIGA